MQTKYNPPQPDYSPRLLLCSPFLNHGELDSVLDIQDALGKMQANIALWADLFTAKADHHSVLDTDQARHGMYLQLTALGYTLAAIDNALDRLKAAP